ncbi:MAG: hypothetical protein R3C45_12895 [Phycisphaerales bacterium]
MDYFTEARNRDPLFEVFAPPAVPDEQDFDSGQTIFKLGKDIDQIVMAFQGVKASQQQRRGCHHRSRVLPRLIFALMADFKT